MTVDEATRRHPVYVIVWGRSGDRPFAFLGTARRCGDGNRSSRAVATPSSRTAAGCLGTGRGQRDARPGSRGWELPGSTARRIRPPSSSGARARRQCRGSDRGQARENLLPRVGHCPLASRTDGSRRPDLYRCRQLDSSRGGRWASIGNVGGNRRRPGLRHVQSCSQAAHVFGERQRYALREPCPHGRGTYPGPARWDRSRASEPICSVRPGPSSLDLGLSRRSHHHLDLSALPSASAATATRPGGGRSRERRLRRFPRLACSCGAPPRPPPSSVASLGWPPPAAPAAPLAVLLALSRIRQRRVEPNALLSATALCVLLIDPWSVLDLGGWLSVAALWGATMFTRWSDRALRPTVGWRTLASSVGATLATAPLTAAVLGTVATIGILLNFVAIPLAAVAIPGVFASLIMCPVWPWLAGALAGGGGLGLHLLELLATAGAALPFG